MFNIDASLAAIRAALDPINPDSTEQQMRAATSVATAELRRAAAVVASYANALDDGTGFFNSSSEFGRQLGVEFDEARRGSTVMGLIEALSLEETLFALQVALMHLQVQTRPHAVPRSFLDEEQQATLARIRDTAAAALVDSALGADIEK
jgi:hypothetical protein